MKNILVVGTILLVALAVISITNSGSVLGVQTGQEVRVAGLFNQTGFAGFAGEASKNGFIMAIEDAGLNPADFVIEDTQSDLTAAVSAAQKLTSVDEADIIIGPEWAEFSEVVIPVTSNAQTLVVSPWMINEGSAFASDYYLSATPSERAQAQAVLAHMHKRGDRAAFVYSKNTWALGLKAVIDDELPNYPNVAVVYETQASVDTVDFKTEIAQMKARGATAVFAVVSAGATSEAFLTQYKTLGTGELYLPYSTYSQLVFAHQSNDLLHGVLFPSDVAYDRTAEFTAKYKARFGTDPSAISAATTYDMTTLVLQAIEEGAEDADDVRGYLMNVKGYRGYSSVIEFGPDGHVVPGAVELRRVTAMGSEIVR